MERMNSVEVQAYVNLFPERSLGNLRRCLPKHLEGLQHTGRRPEDVDIWGVELMRDCNFDGTRIGGLSFAYGAFQDCSFRNITAEYFGCYAQKMVSVDASKSYCENLDFADCELTDCRFDNMRTRSMFAPASTFLRCSFRGIRTQWAKFSGVRFRSCDLSGSYFHNMHVDSAWFQNCVFDGVKIDRLFVSTKHPKRESIREWKAAFPGVKIREVFFRKHGVRLNINTYPRWQVR